MGDLSSARGRGVWKIDHVSPITQLTQPDNEVVLDREGGSFTFEIDVKSDNQEGEWKTPKNPARRNIQMDVDESVPVQNMYGNLWEEEYEELTCPPCESVFQRH